MCRGDTNSGRKVGGGTTKKSSAVVWVFGDGYHSAEETIAVLEKGDQPLKLRCVFDDEIMTNDPLTKKLGSLLMKNKNSNAIQGLSILNDCVDKTKHSATFSLLLSFINGSDPNKCNNYHYENYNNDLSMINAKAFAAAVKSNSNIQYLNLRDSFSHKGVFTTMFNAVLEAKISCLRIEIFSTYEMSTKEMDLSNLATNTTLERLMFICKGKKSQGDVIVLQPELYEQLSRILKTNKGLKYLTVDKKMINNYGRELLLDSLLENDTLTELCTTFTLDDDGNWIDVGTISTKNNVVNGSTTASGSRRGSIGGGNSRRQLSIHRSMSQVLIEKNFGSTTGSNGVPPVRSSDDDDDTRHRLLGQSVQIVTEWTFGSDENSSSNAAAPLGGNKTADETITAIQNESRNRIYLTCIFDDANFDDGRVKKMRGCILQNKNSKYFTGFNVVNRCIDPRLRRRCLNFFTSLLEGGSNSTNTNTNNDSSNSNNNGGSGNNYSYRNIGAPLSLDDAHYFLESMEKLKKKRRIINTLDIRDSFVEHGVFSSFLDTILDVGVEKCWTTIIDNNNNNNNNNNNSSGNNNDNDNAAEDESEIVIGSITLKCFNLGASSSSSCAADGQKTKQNNNDGNNCHMIVQPEHMFGQLSKINSSLLMRDLDRKLIDNDGRKSILDGKTENTFLMLSTTTDPTKTDNTTNTNNGGSSSNNSSAANASDHSGNSNDEDNSSKQQQQQQLDDSNKSLTIPLDSSSSSAPSANRRKIFF